MSFLRRLRQHWSRKTPFSRRLRRVQRHFAPPAACKRRPRRGMWSSSAHFFSPFVIAHLGQVLCHGRRWSISFLRRLRRAKRRRRRGTWSSFAHFYRALFYQRRTYIIYLPRLQLQHVIFCTVQNAIFATPAACKTTTSTRYVIFNCHFFLVFLINAQLTTSDACAM